MLLQPKQHSNEKKTTFNGNAMEIPRQTGKIELNKHFKTTTIRF